MSLKRHTVYNLGGALAPLAMMLVTVPLYIGLLGEARYGVLAIVWVLTGYFGFFDLGLGRATAFAIARSDREDPSRAPRVLWTALAVNTGFGIVGGAILALLAPLLFGRLLAVPPALLEELLAALPWLALAIPLLTVESVLTGALTGRERFLALNIRAAIGAAITQALPLLLVFAIAPTLTVAVIATVLARFASVALFAGITLRTMGSGLRPQFGGTTMVRELIGYGGWVSIGSAIGPLVANLDRLLIGALAGPVAVALYTVPYQLVTRGAMVSRAIAGALFPRMAQTDTPSRRELAIRAMRFNAGLMTVPCVIGVFLMEPFLSVWIGPDFALTAALIGQLLVVTLLLNALSLVAANLIEADARPREAAFIQLSQIAPFFVLLYLGIGWAGVAGAAAARCCRSVLDLSLLAWRADLLAEAGRIVAVPLLLVLCSIGSAYSLGSASAAGLIAAACAISAASVWSLRISVDLKRFVAVDIIGRLGIRA